MSELTEPYGELLRLADSLDELAELGRREAVQQPLKRLEAAAEEIGRAWSGSWIGDHARVYYRDLQPPPPGARFSQEWGLVPVPPNDTTGDWVLFEAGYVHAAIFVRAENPNIRPANEFQNKVATEFVTQKLNVLSVLEVFLKDSNDNFLTRLKDTIDSLSHVSLDEEVDRYSPKTRETRDQSALSQSNQIVPPHIAVRSQARVVLQMSNVVTNLAEWTRHAARHVSRLRGERQPGRIVGTKVFIGHGPSLVWLELKEFLENRLKLQVAEFNSVSSAGVPNTTRLSEMMDEAAFAFLVMTGDDEFLVANADLTQRGIRRYPRLNVVHEAGLFQGRLGFKRAIVVFEEGCQEFSNIEGVVQIRFPRGAISGKFEEIRRVLEREELIAP